MYPALAGGFLTAEPPGKSWENFCYSWAFVVYSVAHIPCFRKLHKAWYIMQLFLLWELAISPRPYLGNRHKTSLLVNKNFIRLSVFGGLSLEKELPGEPTSACIFLVHSSFSHQPKKCFFFFLFWFLGRYSPLSQIFIFSITLSAQVFETHNSRQILPFPSALCLPIYLWR